MIRIRSPQDLGAAALLFVLGATGVWYGGEYTIGTAARMGPGYMPMVLSTGLILFALTLAVKSVAVEGPAVETMKLRPIVLVLGAIVAFAFLIRPLGLLPTTFLVVMLCGLGTPDVRWKELTIVAAVLAIFVVAVFVYGLNQTIPVFGDLITGG